MGVHKATYFAWKKKFGGMEVSDAKRLRALEDENRRLKRLVADLSLDNVALKDVLSKKWRAHKPALSGQARHGSPRPEWPARMQPCGPEPLQLAVADPQGGIC